MSDNDRVISEFDQTNGKVAGLEGDDGGALDENAPHRSVLDEAVKGLEDTLGGEEDDEHGDGAVTSYSEEGDR